MALSEAQTFGFSENVQELLQQQAKALKEGGLDVETILRRLKALHERAMGATHVQAGLRVSKMDSTAEANSLQRELYVAASSCLDMAIGAVQKNSTAARVFRTFRSRIRRFLRGETVAEESGEPPQPSVPPEPSVEPAPGKE